MSRGSVEDDLIKIFLNHRLTMGEIRYSYVRACFKVCGNNKTEVARQLRMTRETVSYYLRSEERRYGCEGRDTDQKREDKVASYDPGKGHSIPKVCEKDNQQDE